MLHAEDLSEPPPIFIKMVDILRKLPEAVQLRRRASGGPNRLRGCRCRSAKATRQTLERVGRNSAAYCADWCARVGGIRCAIPPTGFVDPPHKPQVLTAFVRQNFWSRICAVLALGNPTPDTEAASMFHRASVVGRCRAMKSIVRWSSGHRKVWPAPAPSAKPGRPSNQRRSRV
jgi:hypothetical protein